MMSQCKTNSFIIVVASLLSSVISPFASAQSGKLAFKEAIARDSLKTVVAIAISPDGKFAYAAGYNANAVTAFKRDPKTGKLKHLQTFEDKDLLGGSVAIRLSPDGKLGVATCFKSNTVALFSRDAKTGKLRLFDVAKNGERGAKDLNFVIDATFSPDGKFVYAIADGAAAVVTLRVVEGKLLEFVESNKGRDDCFKGARGIAVSADGKFLYVTSALAGTLVVLARDADSGKTAVKQVLKNGVDGAEGLLGAFAVACSPDGKFVYTSSGRFRGTTAISAFQRKSDGTLKFVETLTDLTGFNGGNEIRIGPKGKHVYACGTKSSSLLVLKRDSKSGKLTPAQTLKNKTDGKLSSVAGLAISSDGRFVYAAAENDGAISIYERKVESKSKK